MSEPEGFPELWLLWRDHARKSDGRGKARPTYAKWLQAGADPADIMDGARWHLRSMKPEERPYIQLLSVYLNSERWADECEKERAFQARQHERPANVVQMQQPKPARKTAFLELFEQQKAGA
jgi:hypothetical protein